MRATIQPAVKAQATVKGSWIVNIEGERIAAFQHKRHAALFQKAVEQDDFEMAKWAELHADEIQAILSHA